MNINQPIDQLISKNLNHLFPGIVILVKKGGEIIFERSRGVLQRYDENKEILPLCNQKPVHAHTLFDLASVTKVMATTQACMKLYFEKKLRLDQKVYEFFPNFEMNEKKNITIKNLLGHTSGLAAWEPIYLYANDSQGVLNYIKNMSLSYPTNSKYVYSDINFLLLGLIIEMITAQKLNVYLEQQIFSPLNMHHTLFLPLQNFDKNQIAATSWGNPYEKRICDEENFPNFIFNTNKDLAAFKNYSRWRDALLRGESNDCNCALANQGVAGHAGLFSTASDLSILGDVMLNQGIKNNIQIYDEETIEIFTSLQKFNCGLGWKISNFYATYLGDVVDNDIFSHNGFTGTYVIFNKKNRVQIVILTNKLNMGLNSQGYYPNLDHFVAQIVKVIYSYCN